MINKKYYHPEIKWYTRLLPWFWFANADDPVPPSRFDGHYRDFWLYRWLRKIGISHRISTAIWWGTRNPLHNFMYYTIGLAGRDIAVHSKYPGELFAPKGFNWLVTKYKWLRFPGISYKGKTSKWYIGWMDDGEFGVEAKRLSIWSWLIIACCVYLILGFLFYKCLGWIIAVSSWKAFLIWPIYLKMWF